MDTQNQSRKLTTSIRQSSVGRMSRSRSTASDNDNHRPGKKLRALVDVATHADAMLASAIILNNAHGLEIYRSGQYLQAEHFFMQALLTLCGEGSSSSSSSSSSSFTMGNLSPLLSPFSQEGATPDAAEPIVLQQKSQKPRRSPRLNGNGRSAERSNGDHDRHAAIRNRMNEKHGFNIGSTFNPEKSSSAYHYDEGMNMYKEPLLLVADKVGINVSSGINFFKFSLLYNIGQTYVRRNDFSQAEQWFHQALVEYPPPLFVETTCILVMLLHNLGYCAFRRNHNLVATQCYENALDIAKTMEGSSGHDYIATSLNCIAVMKFVQHPQRQATLKSVGMLRQSLEMHRQIVKDQQTLIKCTGACPSAMSPSVTAMATVMNNLGRVYYFNRNYEQALTVYKECLQMRKKFLPAGSLDIAVTFYNMGQTYYQLRRSDEALECYNTFRTMILAKLDFESRDVAIVYKCMAELYHERKDLKECHACLVQSMRAARGCLGPFHAEVASILNKLGNVCYELGKYDRAMKHYQEGLEIERIVLGPCHAHTIVTMVNIAHIHKQQKNFRAAFVLYSRVRAIQASKLYDGESADASFVNEENQGDDGDSIATDDDDGAAKSPKSAQQPRKRTVNIEEATSLSNMGLMQYSLKDFRGAFESYQEALRIRREFYQTEEHPDIASTLNSIGLTLFKQKLYELAQGCFAECLRIRKILLGDKHRDVAVVWYNMGTIYFEQGEDEHAVACYKETLRVEEIALGRCHADVVMTLQHIGQVYQQIGRFDEALHYLLEAKSRDMKRVEEVRLGAKEPARTSKTKKREADKLKENDALGLAKICNLIGNLHLQQGNVAEMMEAFAEAVRLIDESKSDEEESNNIDNNISSPQRSLLIAGYNFYGLSKTNPPAAPVA